MVDARCGVDERRVSAAETDSPGPDLRACEYKLQAPERYAQHGGNEPAGDFAIRGRSVDFAFALVGGPRYSAAFQKLPTLSVQLVQLLNHHSHAAPVRCETIAP